MKPVKRRRLPGGSKYERVAGHALANEMLHFDGGDEAARRLVAAALDEINALRAANTRLTIERNRLMMMVLELAGPTILAEQRERQKRAEPARKRRVG